MSDIWQKDSYLTSDYQSLIGKKITEYDMKEAGYNLTIYYNLLSEKRLEYLKTLNKEQRHIQIGIYMRDIDDYRVKLTESFGKMRKLFIEDNGINDSDILSIKKDALFIIGKTCTNLSYRNVNLVPKNTYSSFHLFGNVEMYYNYASDKLDIKGINNDELDKHKYFIKILKKSFRYLETGDIDKFKKFIYKFANDYKNKNLRYDYYRELNSRGMYSLAFDKNDSYRYYIEHINDSKFDDEIDLSFNYVNYILPLIQRFYYPESWK